MSNSDNRGSAGPVDFVVGAPDPVADEELAQPAGNPRLRRARVPLLILAGAVVVAALVTSLVNRPTDTPVAGPATVTATPSASPPSSSQPSSSALSSSPLQRFPVEIPVSPGDTVRINLVPDVACPAGASCAAVTSSPANLRNAVRQAFPDENRLRAVTTLMHADLPGSQLLDRVVTAAADGTHVRIHVGPAGRNDLIGQSVTETAGATITVVRRHVDGFRVVVRVTSPPGTPPSVSVLRRLAADHRLLALT